jgi:XTP/dITP diphosphohydrolase
MTNRHPLEVLNATTNRGKISEFQESLKRLQLQLRNLDEFLDVSPVEEVGTTYEENATIKALDYAGQTALPALADDSGLVVDALGGMPGVFSARFGGDSLSDRDRTAKLLMTLNKHRGQERTARFICCMALAVPGDRNEGGNPQIIHTARGECGGLIAEEARGTNGFGYDPVFLPAGYSASFAELPDTIKRAISHRAHALATMRDFIKLWLAKLDRSDGGS